MDKKVKIGAAVAAGYLLGRTKKGKLALSLALWLGGSEFGLNPKKLARQGLTALARSPQAANLTEQIRGPVAEAAGKAAIAVLESRVNQLSDALHDRTMKLQGSSTQSKNQDDSSEAEGNQDQGNQEHEDEPVEAHAQEQDTSGKPA